MIIEDVPAFRDQLYSEWSKLNCFGRIYVANEGVNAQMSVPENKLRAFLEKLDSHQELKNMHIKYAVEDDGQSFNKLIIKNRKKILLYCTGGIRCEACAEKNEACCSNECNDFSKRPKEEQLVLRKKMIFNGTKNSHRGLR